MNAGNLKEQVLSALTKQGGGPVDEITNLFNDPVQDFAGKMSELFDADIANASDLMDELFDSNSFNKVFSTDSVEYIGSGLFVSCYT